MPAMTVDDELDARWDVLANDIIQAGIVEERSHRCPPDMPPCPDCQAVEEAEDEKEFWCW